MIQFEYTMRLNFKSLFYNVFIDPLLAGLKCTVAEKIPEGATVIDIACGTGSLAFTLARKAQYVTGIDIDHDLIHFATKNATKRKIRNIQFQAHDATDLSVYNSKQFEIAVSSMAVHQFSEELAVRILKEMKRIASQVIIADYNSQMQRGFSRSLAYLIESLAKDDHHKNFRNYMSKGGLKWFTDSAGLSIKSTSIKGYGVFLVAVCE
jgi:2-polyprenyl-3-methyl-5-hydroxy-6-metoxy-1,4-benzoquinol methylase